MKEKGQITVEFFIAISVLVFIFAFSLSVYNERNQGFIFSRESYNSKLLAQELADGINVVFLAGDGAETIVLLENKGDFNVDVVGSSVQVSWRGGYADSKILTERVTVESLSLGGRVNIRNRNGGITVENA